MANNNHVVIQIGGVSGNQESGSYIPKDEVLGRVYNRAKVGVRPDEMTTDDDADDIVKIVSDFSTVLARVDSVYSRHQMNVEKLLIVIRRCKQSMDVAFLNKGVRDFINATSFYAEIQASDILIQLQELRKRAKERYEQKRIGLNWCTVLERGVYVVLFFVAFWVLYGHLLSKGVLQKFLQPFPILATMTFVCSCFCYKIMKSSTKERLYESMYQNMEDLEKDLKWYVDFEQMVYGVVLGYDDVVLVDVIWGQKDAIKKLVKTRIPTSQKLIMGINLNLADHVLEVKKLRSVLSSRDGVWSNVKEAFSHYLSSMLSYVHLRN